MSHPTEFDVAVVGAGLVGLASALQLTRLEPALSVCVLEAAPTIASHQSGHNSGVVHAGVYYWPGSLKAQLCREGRAELLELAREHAIPYRQDGKLIVAVRRRELARLDNLRERARANGLRGVRLLRGDELREIEPHVAAEYALHVPETGVIDFGAVARAYANELGALGGQLRLGWSVTAIERRAGGWTLRSDEDAINARALLCCAGLFADRLARMTSPGARCHAIVPFRGRYHTLVGEAADAVRSLIYPVPDPRLPFLGVHFTRAIDGRVRVGPNAVPALARHGDGRPGASWADVREALAFPGTLRLARRHLRVGAAELWRDAAKPAFVRELRQYLPELRAADLRRDGGGVRAQCVAADGTLVDDFLICDDEPGLIHVLSAPSPAATASPAIGRMVAERVLRSMRSRS